MVKRLVRLFAILLLVVPLSGCLFVMSVFPATLSQVVARADMSAIVPAGSQYQPFIVTPTGGEFVILMSRNSATGPVVVVMDSNLNLIQTYTLAQLNGWGAYDTSGNQVMTDAGGNVEISNFGFSAAELATVSVNPSWINPTVHDPNFGSPFWQKNDLFQAAGNTLTYTQYQWWGFDFSSPAIQVNGASGNYRIQAAYDVDDTLTGHAILVLTDQNNSSNVTLVSVPLSDIRFNVVAPPLLNNYPYTTLSNIDSSSIGFAGDSLVAYDNNSGSLKRYSATPPFNEIGSVPMTKSNGQLQYAYRMTGGYSVVYDPGARTLTKVANWW